RNGARRAQRSRARLPRSCLQAGVNPLSVRGGTLAKIGAEISVRVSHAQSAVLRRNFLRFHALTSGLSGATSRQEKVYEQSEPAEAEPTAAGQSAPGQQQGGGGQKPGQQQQGGGQHKPPQQPGQGGHQGGQQGGMDR